MLNHTYILLKQVLKVDVFIPKVLDVWTTEKVQ